MKLLIFLLTIISTTTLYSQDHGNNHMYCANPSAITHNPVRLTQDTCKFGEHLFCSWASPTSFHVCDCHTRGDKVLIGKLTKDLPNITGLKQESWTVNHGELHITYSSGDSMTIVIYHLSDGRLIIKDYLTTK